ncbi:MAG: integrase core domain-containing protein [Candidatus Didemnitutus sp.]|nr:integrase core domain-containing protein [Candidatus Didemnitutus sp.]
MPPEKPSQNGCLESFTASSATIDAYRNDYNLNRPHRALGGLTPSEFAAQIA